jgi:hypothetical protein
MRFHGFHPILQKHERACIVINNVSPRKKTEIAGNACRADRAIMSR